MHTAVAQVFNERGDGVVVRGGTAKISKSDLQPHLSETDCRKLLTDALTEYRRVHGHQPARVVLHKSSDYSREEIAGFHKAADEREIDFVELLWIQRRGAPHLFRTGQLPPLRGTTVQLDPRTMLLYTRGSISLLPNLSRHVRPATSPRSTGDERHEPHRGGYRCARPVEDELEQRPTRRTRPSHAAHRIPGRRHPQARASRGADSDTLRPLHVTDHYSPPIRRTEPGNPRSDGSQRRAVRCCRPPS